MTKKILIFFLSKIAIDLSLGLHKGRPSYRRSFQPSKENISHYKLDISKFFPIFLWVIVVLLDPVPKT
jgi:hypothetical protein